MSSSLRPVAVMLLLMTAVGCGALPSTNSEGRKPTMDMGQGAEQADAILQQTLGDITPPLRWNHGPSNDIACSNMLGKGTGTGTVERLIVILTKVSAERRGSLLGIVERSWKARGYKITGVNRDKDMPAIFATTPDHFQIVLEVGATGQFGFSAVTPCLTHTDNIPDPAPTPNTPQRDVPYPAPDDIHDDFWSAPTPGAPTPHRSSPSANR
ncbi:hypothetical protein AB0G73_24455 [Streptomyces sp. NPDC020719]|uniref:hypothetical protein n=1 Tax=unclassified Streptomyces TaxID=2593676 RepID=UPI0033F890A4